jgi:hypothetical protein
MWASRSACVCIPWVRVFRRFRQPELRTINFGLLWSCAFYVAFAQARDRRALFGSHALEGVQVIITPPVRALFCNAFGPRRQGAVTSCISAIQTVAR